jgi:hypothetical protein
MLPTDGMHHRVPTEANYRLPAVPPASELLVPPKIVLRRMIAVPI